MTRFRRILCPTDFSPPSQHALNYAGALAKENGAELILLHVVPPSAYPIRNFGTITGFPNLHDEIQKRVQQELAEARQSIDPALAVKTEIRDGVPHVEVLAAAADHDCDLIVVATHGHTGLKHALLGSTTERIVRLATCPVLTLRHPD